MSRYQTFRRIAGPVAIVLAFVLIGRTACNEQDRQPVRFSLDVGDRAEDVRHVRVDLWVDDRSIGYFESSYPSGITSPVRFEQPVPRADLEATIDVTFASSDPVRLRRRIHASPGSDVILDARP